MKYRAEYHFKWLIILFLLTLIYLSNCVLIKLPFINICFDRPYKFLPQIYSEFYVYNLQTVVVWTTGILFGPKIGLTASCIYLLIGFLGIPVFAGGEGLDYYKEPTFGYLISFPVLAFLSGKLYEQNKKFLAILIPILITHSLGILYLLLFQQNRLDLSWHLSFSMIGYDLIFALLITPLMPLTSFILREIFTQEVLVRSYLSDTGNNCYVEQNPTQRKSHYTNRVI